MGFAVLLEGSVCMVLSEQPQLCKDIVKSIKRFYVSINKKIEIAEYLCKKMGIDDVGFNNPPNIKSLDLRPGEVLIPIVHADGEKEDAINRTFEKAVGGITLSEGHEVSRNNKLKKLSIHPESEYHPGLSWGVLNIIAHRNKSAIDCWGYKNRSGYFAHSEILIFCAIYEDLIKYWIENNSIAPSFNCSGLQVYEERYSCPKVPYINFLENELSIGVGMAGYNFLNVFNPVVRVLS